MLAQSERERYAAMGSALQDAPRPMLFSMCDWGLSQPWLYGHEVGPLKACTACSLLPTRRDQVGCPLTFRAPCRSACATGACPSPGSAAARWALPQRAQHICCSRRAEEMPAVADPHGALRLMHFSMRDWGLSQL